MVQYGTELENGRQEPFAETDEFSLGGDQFLIRVTGIHPYKEYDKGLDDLLTTIDFHNLATGVTGRFENVVIPARQARDNNQRRHSVFRALPSMFAQLEPVPSPVFPL